MAKKKTGSKKLSADARRSLPSKDFGLPGMKRFPVDTKARARNAKARAAQAYKDGRISKDQLDQIVKAADRKIAGGAAGAKKAGLATASKIASRAQVAGKSPLKPKAERTQAFPKAKKASKKRASKKSR